LYELHLHTPALTIAIALAAGVIAQGVARHVRIPGIVLLLGCGVLLGPDVLHLISPDRLGGALGDLVGFAVAVILFEGGLNLDWRRLRREAVVIRRLVLLGAVVTAALAAPLARYALGWTWSHSVLFGTLVVVTGPTVITPLLRRVRIRRRLETVLTAEGVLIDAVGAVLAVVALEVVLSPGSGHLPVAAMDLASRIGFGLLVGVPAGFVLAGLLGVRRLVPEGLETIFALSLALLLYQGANAFIHESGLVAVIAAGIVLGNSRSPIDREMKEFKERLTVLLIGLLFVLLAADVRLADVLSLGYGALVVVAALVFLIRPVSVALCTAGTELGWQERSLLAWVAPRGIVAAFVSSLFAERLAANDIPGGTELRAMVFLVIVATVVLQGPTVGVVAWALGVRRPTGQGYAILGATPLARLLGRLLSRGGHAVVLIDSSPQRSHEAQEDDLRVVFGNALEEGTLYRAELDTRRGALGVLANDAVNLLFAREARERFGLESVAIATAPDPGSVTDESLRELGASRLFSGPTDAELWSVRIRRGSASIETWIAGESSGEGGAQPSNAQQEEDDPREVLRGVALPLVYRREGQLWPVTEAYRSKPKDLVAWLVLEERREEATEQLRRQGWSPSARGDDAEAALSSDPAP
jgi:NhaP-type Na+/H+ or K+/H+ antiporter